MDNNRHFRKLLITVTLAACNTNTTLPNGKADNNSPSDAIAEGGARNGEIDDGALVKELSITRFSRDAAEVSSRAAALATELAGNTCASSEALPWASKATSEGYAADMPFRCSPEIRVIFDSGRDVLTVRNEAKNAPLVESKIVGRATALGGLGAEVPKSEATTIADRFVNQASLSGVLLPSSGAWVASSVRGYIDGVSSPTAGTASTIRSFGVIFRREFEDIPLLDTYLEVRVDAYSREIVQVTVADVGYSVTGREFVKMGSLDASQIMHDQLQSQASDLGADSFILKGEQAAYVLAGNDDAGVVFPVHHGLAIPQAENGTLGHTAPVVLAMVYTSGEDFLVKFAEQRPSRVVPPATDGDVCHTDHRCDSGSCFGVADGLGFCGECSAPGDCGAGNGCQPPLVLGETVRGALCVPLARGVLCENHSDCATGDRCGTLDVNDEFSLRVCGGCAPDEQLCPAGTECRLSLMASQIAYRECKSPSELGHVCEEASDCASGHCVSVNFESGREVGVCSECSADPECSTGQTCGRPGITAGVGFVGGACI